MVAQDQRRPVSVVHGLQCIRVGVVGVVLNLLALVLGSRGLPCVLVGEEVVVHRQDTKLHACNLDRLQRDVPQPILDLLRPCQRATARRVVPISSLLERFEHGGSVALQARSPAALDDT